jgi:hypothetical protein
MASNPKLDRLLGRMSDLEHQSVDKDLEALLYGPPGTGKTTLAMGLAQKLAAGRDIIYVDSADGWVSLEDFPGLLANTHRVAFEEYSDLMGLSGQLALPPAKRVKAFQQLDVAVIVLDELSSMADTVLDTVLRERLGTKDEDIPDVVPEWSDYFPQKELIRKAVLAFHGIDGLHVISTAHAKEKVDHRKVKVTRPDFPDKLLGELQKIMHVTGFVSSETGMKSGEVQYTRRIQIQPTALIEAKTRIRGLPYRMELPTFVRGVDEWINSGQIAADLAADEDTTLAEDELPTDGLPVSDDNSDDEGVEVE